MAKIKTVDTDVICRVIARDLAEGARRYMDVMGQKKVKEMMSKTIDEKVYDRYTPKKYERRGELKKIDNMKREVKVEKYKPKQDNHGVEYIEGHLYITNKAKRNVLPGAKKKYEYTKKADFLYGIEDGSDTDEYDHRIGNFCHSSTFDEWGHGGQPLYINAELSKKVEKSEELVENLRRSAIVHAEKAKSKRQS